MSLDNTTKTNFNNAVTDVQNAIINLGTKWAALKIAQAACRVATSGNGAYTVDNLLGMDRLARMSASCMKVNGLEQIFDNDGVDTRIADFATLCAAAIAGF